MLPNDDRQEEQKVIPVNVKMMNFELAKSLALEAIREYQEDLKGSYWTYVSLRGQNRASHLEQYLVRSQASCEKDEANLLALFLSVFTITPTNPGFFINPFSNFGCSSELVRLIAQRWIQGDRASDRNMHEPVTSQVFSEDALAHALRDPNNRTSVVGGPSTFIFFDRTKAVRQLLNLLLNSPMCENFKADIIKSVPKLRAHLESNQSPSWSPSPLLLPCSPADQAIIEATLQGAFASNNEENATKVKDITDHVSLFLTRKDTANLQVNKASVVNFKSAVKEAEMEVQAKNTRR